MSRIDLGPVDILTVALARREPASFYLQGRIGARQITVELSLEMLQALTTGIPEFLAEVHERYPHLPPEGHSVEEGQMGLFPPLSPLFRVGTVGLGYDPENDLVVLELREQVAREQKGSPRTVRFWCTRDQVLQLVLWSMEVLRSTLPTCPQCGQIVEDLETHICPRKNGHNATS